MKSELLLKDLETIGKRIDGFAREIKSAAGNDPRHTVLKIMEIAKALIEQGKWLRDVMDDEEIVKIADLQLLSFKKYMYVVNSDEGDLQKPSSIDGGFRICVKLEEELVSLSDDEQKEYLAELGQKEPGLNILIRKAYETLNLASYFTAGPKEVRAWTIKKGTLAPQAAGVIHGDFERGFIAAEVCNFSDLVEVGGWQAAKGKGLVKTIGKTEEVKDGMVVEFRFSV